ncbi:MAG: cobalamin-binding protein [Smithellaceae bacterium]|nr:cobalamin-binding protein [Smithellaceae bacterium]
MKIKIFGACWCIILILAAPHGLWAKTYPDDLGRRITLAKPPERIVSLAPNVTEILFALGLGGRVVGVTTFCNYPPEVSQITRIGGFVNPSLEAIVSLQPDLIIGTADGNKRETVEQLERLNLPVYIINPSSLEGVFSSLIKIGDLTGQGKNAQKLVESQRKRLARVEEKTRGKDRPMVFLQIGLEPIVTAGKDTVFTELIELAGGRNVFDQARTRYPRLGIEAVIRERPEIIIVTSMEGAEDFSKARRFWRRWPGIPAVKNDRIFRIDPDMINRPSPRIIDALDILTDLFHPD